MPTKRIRRFIGAPNSEVELTSLRCFVGTLIVGYLWAWDLVHPDAGEPPLWRIVPPIYIVSAYVLSWLARRELGPRCLRRITGMVLDLGAGSIMLATLGASAAFIYGGFFWVTIGYGFRFGVGALFLSQAIAIVGFIGIYLYGPYWQSQPALYGGMLAGLVIVPPYFAIFVIRLRDSQRRLRAANAAKSRFIAKMSHEIRTPLNGIIGACELLELRRMSRDEADLLRIVADCAAGLRTLVEDVLDFSKIEAGRMTTVARSFSPDALLRSVMKSFAPQSIEKGQRHELVFHDLPQTVVGDERHLRQVLINLVGNAVKFTQPSGVVTVRARTVATRKDLRLRVEVHDNGPGVDPRIRKSLFKPFVQADESTTRVHGGTGLGTTIAYELVRLMKGTIGFASRPGDTIFWIELPVLTCDEARVDAPLSDAMPIRSDQRLHGMRILIADDNRSNLKVLTRFLELAGAAVTAVSNGQRALHALTAADRFDLAILDVHMPGLDGVEVLRRRGIHSRASDDATRLPIVMLSADVTPETRSKALAAGAVAVLEKPTSRAELISGLARLLSAPAYQPIIDRAKIADLDCLGKSAQARMVWRLLEDADRTRRRINVDAARNDNRSVRDMVHGLHGGMVLIGATRFATYLRSVEDRLQRNAIVDVSEVDRRIDASLREVRAELSRIGITHQAVSMIQKRSGPASLITARRSFA